MGHSRSLADEIEDLEGNDRVEAELSLLKSKTNIKGQETGDV